MYALRPVVRGTALTLSALTIWLWVATAPLIVAEASVDAEHTVLRVGLILTLSTYPLALPVWLVANRRRDMLWLTPEGIGYWPGRADDDGFLPWSQVLSFYASEVSSPYAVPHVGHVWKIVPISGPVTTIYVPPGVRYQQLSDATGDVPWPRTQTAQLGHETRKP